MLPHLHGSDGFFAAVLERLRDLQWRICAARAGGDRSEGPSRLRPLHLTGWMMSSVMRLTKDAALCP